MKGLSTWIPPRAGVNRNPHYRDRRVNLNTASASTLQTLNGIGKASAERIIVHRTQSPFRCVDDLARVGGINSKTIDRIRSEVKV